MLTLEASKAYKAMGGPQVFTLPMYRRLGPEYNWYLVRQPPGSLPTSEEWLACPEDTVALDWLEKEMGYFWGKRESYAEPGYFYIWNPGMIGYEMKAETPSDLILATYQHWVTQQEAVIGGKHDGS